MSDAGNNLLIGQQLTAETFSGSVQQREELNAIYREVLDRFEGQLPELDTYVTEIRSRLMNADASSNEDELGYAGMHLMLAERIAQVKGDRGLSYPSNRKELIAYITAVHRSIWTLGPLDELMDDPDVTDIMVHRWDRISVSRRSTGSDIQLTGLSFASDANMKTIMQSVMAANHKQVNKATPNVDGKIPGTDARILVVSGEVTADENTVAIIRKPSADAFTPEDLVRLRSFPTQVSEFFRLCVVSEANMVVAGATGSGKTALLSALMNYIPRRKHTLCIEDTPEIQVPKDYAVVTRFKTRVNPENPADASNRTIYDMLRSALRANPDYIFVGETRGQEAWEMLQAMKSGHAGVTTIHASDGPDALTRLEGMMSLMANAADADYLRRDIAEVMDLLVIQGWVGLGNSHRRGIEAIYEIVPTVRREDLTLDDLVPQSDMVTAEAIFSNNPQHVRVLGDATLRTLFHFDLAADRLVPGVLPSSGLVRKFEEHGLLDDYLKIRNL